MLTLHNLRFAVFGGLIGLLVALTPGCQKKCAPDNCSGCCTDKNECVQATTDAQCGLGGNACGACGTGQACTDGVCTDTSSNTDAGMVDAGPPPCTNDFMCGPGLICNRADGTCIAGQRCTADYECQPDDPEDRCYKYGRQCTCDLTATGGGVCRVRKAPCEECTVFPDGGGAHYECGEDGIIFGPPGLGAGRCKQLPGDMSGKMYCSYQRVGQCACGTVDDGTGFCRPQSNSCEQVGCNIDRDCPSGAVCSVNRPDAGANSCGGVCVPRCRWDFDLKKEVAPGCPPGNTCWVDSANLNPDSIYYGSGRCKPPCSDNTDCQDTAQNPFGGANLKCAGEKLQDGTESPKRCRANGQCMDSIECEPILNLPDTQPYIGYCDRGTFACKSDCRPGVDVVTNLPFKDCRSPFSCSVDGGTNYCRLETCTEQGGASIACAQGEYCCGDDKNFDGIADPCPPRSEQNAAGCYKAPKPPFCTQCGMGTDFSMGLTVDEQNMIDAECAALMPASWQTCTNGSKSPNCSTMKMTCRYAGDRGMSAGIGVCMVPTVNDDGTVQLRYGPTKKTEIACPVNYSVQYVRPQPNPMQGVGYCQTNADCSVLPDGGSSDAGICEPDPSLRQMDGGLLKACRCDAKTGTSQCPNGPAAIGQVNSFCKDGPTGSRQFCIETAYCNPPVGSVYKATTDFGCGL